VHYVVREVLALEILEAAEQRFYFYPHGRFGMKKKLRRARKGDFIILQDEDGVDTQWAVVRDGRSKIVFPQWTSMTGWVCTYVNGIPLKKRIGVSRGIQVSLSPCCVVEE
jgi:hypothetical protein